MKSSHKKINNQSHREWSDQLKESEIRLFFVWKINRNVIDFTTNSLYIQIHFWYNKQNHWESRSEPILCAQHKVMLDGDL
jgi:hypothetical protein